MNGLEVLAVLVFFVGVIALGAWAGRRDQSIEDNLLAGRSMPWWPVTASLIATSLSAATYIGVPDASFTASWWFLQAGFGSLLGILVVGVWFLPAFYGARVATCYQFLGIRFGAGTERYGVGVFLLTRLLGSGARLFIFASAVHVLTGAPLVPVLVAVAVVSTGYTLLGGIRGIIWTDVVQLIILLGVAIVIGFIVYSNLPPPWQLDGWSAKTQIIHLNRTWASWNDGTTFGPSFLFGLFLSMAALGTDQDLMQRMLTCPDLESVPILVGI